MTFAADLYLAMSPLARGDAEESFALRDYTSAIGEPFEWVCAYALDTDAGPGWSLIMNPETCPPEGLAWLGQFVGVDVNPSFSEAQQRAQVAAHLGFARGTPAAIIAATGATLTGTRTVYLLERLDDDAYKLGVVTRTSETPDAELTLAAAQAATPAGIVVQYATDPGAPYDVAGTGSTYDDWKTRYATYADLLRGT